MLTRQDMEQINSFLEDYGKYSGYLSAAQIAEGVSHCVHNARTLLEDARLLYDGGRSARALALAFTSLEEAGKVHVLLAMARIPKENQKLWRDKWQSLRDHEDKGARGMIATWPLQDANAANERDVIVAAMLQRQIAPVGERIRQIGLYVDYRAKANRWCTPAEVRPEDARRVMDWTETAVAQVEALEKSGATTPEGLRIMREVVGGLLRDMPREKDLKGEDIERMLKERGRIFTEYYRRMVAAGLMDLSALPQPYGAAVAEALRRSDERA